MAAPMPSVGRIVHYTLTDADASLIEQRRNATTDIGNRAEEGQVFPAVVVRVFEPAASVNLKVLLDGTDDYWATSRSEGEGAGRWSWPPRV